MSPPPPRSVWVTGASSGFGAAITRALGELGWSLALGARRVDRLEKLGAEVEAAGGRAFVHALDVRDADSIEEFCRVASAALGPVDALVSNAGMASPGLLHQVDAAGLRDEIETNLLGPLRLVQRVLPGMLERRRGDLVFVTSQNAVAPRPFQVGYTASKAGLEGAVRALQMELEGTGVRAAVVRPGPALTEMGRDWDPELLRRMLSAWKRWGLVRHKGYLPPESVARAVVTALGTPRGSQIPVLQIDPEAPGDEGNG